MSISNYCILCTVAKSIGLVLVIRHREIGALFSVINVIIFIFSWGKDRELVRPIVIRKEIFEKKKITF